MSDLTQERLSELLRLGMEVQGIGTGELARRSEFSPATISRYKNPKYAKGPPSAPNRRRLERGLGVPEGYLSGTVSLSGERHIQHKSDGVARSGSVAEGSGGYKVQSQFEQDVMTYLRDLDKAIRDERIMLQRMYEYFKRSDSGDKGK